MIHRLTKSTQVLFCRPPKPLDQEHKDLLLDKLDEDVAAEKERVESGAANGDLIRVQGLTKHFS